MVNPNASGITYRRNETTAPGVFLNATDLRANAKRWFSCRASELGLERGHFPGRLETDAGNGVAFKLDRPLYDEEGKFTGVVYRQSGRLRGVCFARLSRPRSKPASICRTRLARAASVDRMGAGRQPLYPAKQLRVDPIKGRLQRRPIPAEEVRLRLVEREADGLTRFGGEGAVALDEHLAGGRLDIDDRRVAQVLDD